MIRQLLPLFEILRAHVMVLCTVKLMAVSIDGKPLKKTLKLEDSVATSTAGR